MFKENIEYIVLPNTSIKVSRLCFGGCPMGGYGWGKSSEQNFIDAVHSALDNGINFFDTADVYGLGQSEITLGKALLGRRNEAVIATKFGCRRKDGKTYYDNSPEWINKALEESLKRLQTTYIDLYQVHYRDGKTPLIDVISALEKLKKEGKIKAYGISNVHVDEIKQLEKYRGYFSTIQDEYSLATRKNEQDLNRYRDICKLIPMTWGSLGQGILTGDIDENTTFEEGDRRLRPEYVNFHGEKFHHNLLIVNKLKELSQKYHKNIPSIAIRFILDSIKDSIVLVGVMSTKQLLDNKEALGWHLYKEDLDELNVVSEWKE